MRDRSFLMRRLLVLVALTVALAATAFAHRMPNAVDAALEAYVLAGGSLADLCGDADGDGLPDHPDCPVCHLTATAPPTGGGLVVQDAGLILIARIEAPRENRAVRAVLDPARGLRAPPLA